MIRAPARSVSRTTSDPRSSISAPASVRPKSSRSLAPDERQNPNVAAYLERWKKAENRIPNGLPYTQYLYDAPYLVAALFDHVEKNKLPMTGESMRRALLAIKTFDLPMTGKLIVNDDHTVKKPVNLLTVQDGKFVPLATVD